MFTTATHYISVFNTNYVEPTIDWSKKHNKMLIPTIGVGILLGAICYKSPQALDVMKKNIKFVTVIVPIAYTLTFPVVILLSLVAGNVVHREFNELLGLYYRSIPKVWQAWFNFIGIPS